MERLTHRLLRATLQLFFTHLYTTLAWAYDSIAWLTSMGQWREWQMASLENLPEGELLELGHGTGHILVELNRRGRAAIGVDASSQMTQIARRRMDRGGYKSRILRAVSQNLPLPTDHFGGVISTFSSEFILDPQTAEEIWRILRYDGKFILIPSAQITGRSVPDRLSAWLFRVTHQAGGESYKWLQPYIDQGFQIEIEQVYQTRAVVTRIVASKA